MYCPAFVGSSYDWFDDIILEESALKHCLRNDETVTRAKGILDEILPLFPN